MIEDTRNSILTLVIPIYNAERFLRECLLSVLEQLEPNCEVILVDDGSEDASVDIIRNEFSQSLDKKEFVLIRIPNSGPGEARNVGVRAASGAYIGFLDSDDLLLPGYFLNNLNTIAEYQPQIIQFHCKRFQTGVLEEATKIPIHRSSPGLYRLDEIRNDVFGVGKWFPCARVFSRDLLLKYPFPSERVFYEDLITLPFIFFNNVPIVLLDFPLVAYRDNEQGTTRNHQSSHVKTLQSFLDQVSQLPNSIVKDTLIIQLARTIIYFTEELRLDDTPAKLLIKKVRKIQRKGELSVYLNNADKLFLHYPAAYFFCEKIRQHIKRYKLRK